HSQYTLAERPFQPLRSQVNAEHLLEAAVPGDPGAHVADRPETEDGERAAGRHIGVLDRLPRGGQHVGQVHEPVVRRALGYLDRAELGLRYPQELRLPTGYLTIELGVPEQRRALAVPGHLRRLALGR